MEVFGSASTDLCLPTSDIDLVIVGTSAMSSASTSLGQNPFGDMTKELIQHLGHMFHRVQAIPMASVPIIKLVYKTSKSKGERGHGKVLIIQ